MIFSLTLQGQTNKQFYIEKNFDTDKIVASVDSINITAEEFFLNYEFGPAFVKNRMNSKEKHLEYMINEKLLALDGYSRNLDTTDEIASMINEYKNDLATEELFKDKILPQIDVDEYEIDTIIKQKQTELEIKWLYADDEESVKNILEKLNAGISFDSLFSFQINDSVLYDERSMKTNRYLLQNKNPLLAGIIDSLQAGRISVPVHVDDGWYILKLVNIVQTAVTTESEYLKLKQEATNAAIKRKMDLLSDNYVHELMLLNNPVIKRDAFNLVRSYLARHLISEEKFEEWQLNTKLQQALERLGEDLSNSVLVTLNGSSISVSEFLKWYRNRSLYIKLNEDDIRNFSASLEQLVWRMVRDKLLTQKAIENNYDESEEVTKQLLWWKDKILSSAVRNEIAKSVLLQNVEVDNDNHAAGSDSEQLNFDFQKKLLHKILSLKQKYKTSINKAELNSVPVSQENDPKAIEFYSVKKGGLIPRTPYPTINHEWVNWE